jgi:hypothetical protein
LSPLSAANATLALKAAEWFLLVLLVMLAPSMRPCGLDYEARLSLIPLSEFPEPPLLAIRRCATELNLINAVDAARWPKSG